MKIRRVEVERFRGIKKLDWTLGSEFICLVGPGDSTKTTVLDAIELALSPRWNVQFYDTDFYDASTESPILIVVTVGDLPDELVSDARFGYCARGWTEQGKLRDEPEDGDGLVLSIRLKVEASLEPSWMVVNDRNNEGRPIGAKDRAKLGCARLGEYLDRNFSWARGSVLSRLTSEADGLAEVLAEAGRTARIAFAEGSPDSMKRLRAAAKEAKRVGDEIGAGARSEYRPLLDVEAVSVGVGGLSLHDGKVPLRRAGLGTRRLLAVAMQREVAKAGGVTLVDEVEHGLEPHRIRRLLRVLRETDGQDGQCHVLMTTHAPIVLAELKSDDVRVVRSTEGVTRVLDVDSSLQPIARKASEAFFARKVLVCEGKTELGLCRRLDQWWAEGGASFGLAGVALADGGGTEAPTVAKAMADLGYGVALLGDSDRPLIPTEATLKGAGVRVLLWAGDVALEERIARDLPWEGLAALVRLAMDHRGKDCIRDAIAARLNVDANFLSHEPLDWLNLDFNETDLRSAIGVTAKEQRVGNKKGWFKRVDLAEDLAGIIIDQWEAIEGTDLRQKIADLRKWAHGDG